MYMFAKLRMNLSNFLPNELR